ncbi:hypothetical protein Y032_0047g1488 [Ancylostoma ceylanicum]|uniref:EF-hand domain-containing protein n=1 Tax=Ancylostoma ceylanicum TaxID=53326 RepID=A0A016UC94_9BILA|nr:hypothetical protein Y032_0047g1488 [Ancylostoma ceylanicum]
MPSNFTTLRGVLFTSPLRVVKHVLGGEGPSRITLRVEWNSDVGTNHFVNEVFGVVTDAKGNTIAVTSRLQDDQYQTDEFQLESGSTFMVMGLGTNTRSASREKNRVELTTQDRLTKRFKMTLMNVFDMFDFDCDGLLSRSEYAAFAVATADTPPDDEEWNLLTSQFDARDGALTMVGFLFMHECEAFSGDDLAVPDIWESLYRLGYDSSLQLQHACPFSIVIENEDEVRSTAQLSTVTRIERESILKGVFDWAEVDNASELGARIFRADYFGMMIVHNNKKEQNMKTYRIEIVEEKNVKWNFYHGQDDIDPSSSGEWVSHYKNLMK